MILGGSVFALAIAAAFTTKASSSFDDKIFDNASPCTEITSCSQLGTNTCSVTPSDGHYYKQGCSTVVNAFDRP